MAPQNDGGILFEEEYITNARGLKTFTCRWLPADRQPKALVFLCHGYGMECSISMQGTGTHLARAGFAVHGMDYEGHGKTEGLQGYVPSFDAIVDDCCAYFTSVCERAENKTRRRFLLGESMGGAVALMVERKMDGGFWNGAVLVAPMCKIADELKPHPVVVSVLTQLCRVIPTWKIIPGKDVVDSAFRDPEYRKKVRENEYCYKGKPRLKTGYELLRVSMEIEKTLDQVSVPFLIVHGGADIVTDPSVSRLLFESAASKDKSFKLYPGMWHGLTSGETQENIDRVFSDIVDWLDERSVDVADSDAAAEGERKAMHDPHSYLMVAKF